MIGNDIVDLNASRKESNWQRKGWMQKIFSQQEQEAIRLSTDREQMVWLFWSMKEAAYKIFNRNSGETSYSPAAFQCSITTINQHTALGKVQHKGLIYHTHTIFKTDYIHTVAKPEKIRNKAHTTILGPMNGQPELPANLTFHKNHLGIPYLLDIHTGQSIDASLSHHGNYFSLVY